jgi:hypothetical protein
MQTDSPNQNSQQRSRLRGHWALNVVRGIPVPLVPKEWPADGRYGR